MKTHPVPIAAMMFLFAAAPLDAEPLKGTIQLGGIVLDEEGDKSAVQETYNIYDGFSLSRIFLEGAPASRSYLRLDLREMNLDSRQGDLVFRVPGSFKLTAGYDQYRSVFDPDRAVTSDRKNLRAGLQVTANDWLGFIADVNYLDRDGDRLGYPEGTESALGTSYDNRLMTGQVGADVKKGRSGGALTWRFTDYSDELNDAADRTGNVLAARLYNSGFLFEKLSHYLRGAYGTRKLSNGNIDYTLANFQYTGVVRPVEAFQFKYHFDANRIDHEGTGLQTDRFRNDIDATWFYRYGDVNGGYGYEMNDDDRRLTSYNTWRVGTTFRYEKDFLARIEYADRVKKDEEELTLLKDMEASRIRAKVEGSPLENLVLGADYAEREREFPDIGVESEGTLIHGFGRYRLAPWGSAVVDYSYADDSFEDLAGGFDTDSRIVTGRLEIDYIRNLRLAGAVTYMDIGKDLDIEKSILSFEGGYRFLRDYRVEVKYNVYNYDDYVLLDRYYTANVVWFDIAYDFHLK